MHTPTKRIEVFTKSRYLTIFLQVPSHGNILEGTFSGIHVKESNVLKQLFLGKIH